VFDIIVVEVDERLIAEFLAMLIMRTFPSLPKVEEQSKSATSPIHGKELEIPWRHCLGF
jgi:hypothetical protein